MRKYVQYSDPIELTVCPEFGFETLVRFGKYKRRQDFVSEANFPLLKEAVHVEARLVQALLPLSDEELWNEIAEAGYEDYPVDALLTYGLEPQSRTHRTLALGSRFEVVPGRKVAPCIYTSHKHGWTLDLAHIQPRWCFTDACEFLVGPPLKAARHTDNIPSSIVPAQASMSLSFAPRYSRRISKVA